ncbi:MAG: hypothetical protein V7629_09700 [Motiliproteus sp.]
MESFTLINKRLLPYCLTSLMAVFLSACSSGPQQRVKLPDLAYPAAPDQPRFYFEQSIRGSADIVEASDDDKMMYFLTGIGKVSEGFGKPFDIATHQGRIFITDTAKRDVLLIDKKMGLFYSVSNVSNIKMSKPMGVATDTAGTLYVLDHTLKSVFLFTRDGAHLDTINLDKHLERPTGIEVNPEGTLAFIVNTGGVSSTYHNIIVFDLATQEIVRTIGTRGDGDGELNLPKDVSLGKDGLLYVVDSGNFRVSVVTQTGEQVRSFGKIGTQHGSFSRPKGIATDADGNVYVVDAGFGNFQIFNPEGQLLMFVGTRSARGSRGEFMLPAGIDVDEDGRVYMVDQYLRKIDVFRPAALAEGQGYFSRSEAAATDPKPATSTPEPATSAPEAAADYNAQ